MTTPNLLDILVNRAIDAGLTTPEESATARLQLEAAQLPPEVLEDFYAEAAAEARQNTTSHPAQPFPQDEQEIVQWLAQALSQAPWVDTAESTYLSPYGTHQALLRITHNGGDTARLAISYSNDEELEEDFDENF